MVFQTYFVILKHTSKEIIECIKTIPESRKEWLLNKFAYEAEDQGELKTINYGKMAIMPLRWGTK